MLETLTCPSCVDKIGSMLNKTVGVTTPEVLFNSSRVKVSFDELVTDSEIIGNKIRKLGYEVLDEK